MLYVKLLYPISYAIVKSLKFKIILTKDLFLGAYLIFLKAFDLVVAYSDIF